MKLTPYEIGQPLWQKLVEHHEEKLAKYRARIENPRILEAERLELAWKILVTKEFLSLGKPAEETVADAE